MKKLKTLCLLLCIVMAFSAAGCAKQSSSDESNGEKKEEQTEKTEKMITVGLTAGPVNTIPVEYVDDVTTWVTQLMYLPLMGLDDDNEYKPQLATSVETEDNKTFTVHLNKDAKWTDGEAVTADDVVFTMDVIANPKTNSVLASFITILEGVDEAGLVSDGSEHVSGVEKVDDYTVNFTTKETTNLGVFNDTVSRRVSAIPEHIFKNEELTAIFSSKEFEKPTVTNGPYKLVSFEKDASVEFEANKDYFMGSPKIEKLNFKIMDEANITVELENGSIDMNSPYGNIPTTDYETVKAMKHMTAFNGSMINMRYLYTNCEVVSDARIRQAISLAIDRNKIIETNFPGYGETTVMPFPNDFKYLAKEYSVPEYNPEEAKRLVKEAGWDEGRTLKITSYNMPLVSQIVAENLTAVGIPAEVDEVDWGTLSDKMFSLDYDFVMMGDSFTATNTVSNLSFMYNDGSNYNNYKNDELAALVSVIPELSDEDEIRSNYQKIQKIVNEEVPSPSLYCTSRLLAVNNRVINGGPKTFGMFLNVQDWDVE